MKSPRLSILISVYNHERFLEECLLGVEQQILNCSYEVIIGEDYSTDNSQVIIDGFLKRNNNWRVERTPENQKIEINGRLTGRNNQINLLRKAQGDYIAFLDGDDRWTNPQKLDLQFQVLEAEKDVNLVFHAVKGIDSESEPIEIKTLSPKTEYTFAKDLILGNFVPTASVLFRNPGYLNIPEWFSKTPMGDLPMCFHAIGAGMAKFVNEVWADYRIHENATWSSRSLQLRRIDFVQALLLMEETLADLDKKAFNRGVRSSLEFIKSDIDDSKEIQEYVNGFPLVKEAVLHPNRFSQSWYEKWF